MSGKGVILQSYRYATALLEPGETRKTSGAVLELNWIRSRSFRSAVAAWVSFTWIPLSSVKAGSNPASAACCSAFTASESEVVSVSEDDVLTKPQLVISAAAAITAVRLSALSRPCLTRRCERR